jgi:hypothetical protein
MAAAEEETFNDEIDRLMDVDTPAQQIQNLEYEALDQMEFMYGGGNAVSPDAALTSAVFEKTMKALILQLRANRIQAHYDAMALIEASKPQTEKKVAR